MNIPSVRRQVNSLLADYNHASRQVREELLSLRSARRLVRSIQQVQKIVQGLAEDVQRKAHERISTIVTRCLEAVLVEDSYQFRIDFAQKRGRTEAELIFERDGLRIDDALESLGGGICDLTSMALRIACLVLSLPRKRKVLFLDEPMRHLSANYRPLAAEFLRALAMELDIQIILVTHHADFEIGKVIRL